MVGMTYFVLFSGEGGTLPGQWGGCHWLIQRFGEATVVPMLLNTSFNVRVEPIVNTPQDALNTFANSGIDTLVMGTYMIERSQL